MMSRAIIRSTMVVLTLITICAILYFSFSKYGLEFGVELGKSFIPGELSIEKIEGKLSSNFTLMNVRYEHSGHVITAKKLHVEWRASLFINNLINIKKLSAQGITIDKNIIFDDNAILYAHGTAGFKDGSLHANVDISAEKIKVNLDTHYDLIISPTLKLKIDANQLWLAGTILVPKADINPVDTGDVASLPSDVVIVSHDKKQKTTDSLDFAINSNIKIILGKKVKLHYKGLKGKMRGEITIYDSPNKPPIATGELNLKDGTYNILGTQLKIDYGKLLFADSPLENPAVNLRASRSVQYVQSSNDLEPFNELQAIQVGIDISGNFDKPKITFFSSPISLAKHDILSLLLLGRMSNSVSSGPDAQLLLQAASLIKFGSGDHDNLVQQVKDVLKVDELGLTTLSSYDDELDSITTQTAFVVGKYITPRFYVHYTRGLEDNLNIVKLKYLLSKRWTLQTETNGHASGIDLFFTISR